MPCRIRLPRTAGTARLGPEIFRRIEVLPLQPFQSDAAEKGWPESSAARIMSSSVSCETRVVEAHAFGEQPEDLDVRSGLARRRQSRPRQLQIVMTVGEIQVGVFQERGGGQQNIGVIGGVGLELLQHNRKQIVAPESTQHRVLIRRNRRGIGVVNHEAFTGGSSSSVSARPSSVILTRRASRPSGERICSSGISRAARLNWKALRSGQLQAAARPLSRSR